MEKNDLSILRELAKSKLEIANDPLNVERRRLWHALHDGRPERPMILAEWGGIRDQEKPFETDASKNKDLKCVDGWARGVEQSLRQDIWRFETLRDDHVVEPFHDLGWHIQTTDFGVSPVVHRVDDPAMMTARSWDAPITNISQDFHKLKHRTFKVEREKTLSEKARLMEVFGDILPLRMRNMIWWTFGLTIQAIDLIGLENLMLFMYDDPDGLHRIMGFLRDDNLALAQWCEQEGLLTLNNGNDYVGSGGEGHTRRLPAPDWREGMPVRMKDRWLLVESQETVGVGPELYREFIFPYHKDLASRFGLVYYGCCEPIHTRWEVVKEIPNLAACSIAPLCNQEIMAEHMKGAYIYSRKPNPTLISTGHFNETLIREDLRLTLGLAKKHGLRLELVMKDVHTLNNEPHRLARWVEIAREESARFF